MCRPGPCLLVNRFSSRLDPLVRRVGFPKILHQLSIVTGQYRIGKSCVRESAKADEPREGAYETLGRELPVGPCGAAGTQIGGHVQQGDDGGPTQPQPLHFPSKHMRVIAVATLLDVLVDLLELVLCQGSRLEK